MITLEDKLYTSTEVAEILGVSLRSVYRYIEENKLDAEIKTATGRHRFSKKNIVDFLYPAGETNPVREPRQFPQPAPKYEKPVEEVEEEQKPVDYPKKKRQDDVVRGRLEKETVKEAPAEVTEEEPIDWLQKFREAAKKFEAEKEATTAADEGTFQPFANMQQEEKYVEPEPKVTNYYFRSRLGGLKEIAQNIDKSARNANMEYAFTLNAGLSLFKPIKPFSVLHAYVKTKDRDFFERSLLLVPSDPANAQISLIVSDEAEVFKNRAEMHGLYVVSKERLEKDITEFGDGTLMEEAKSVLTK